MGKWETPTDTKSLHRRVRELEAVCLILCIAISFLAVFGVKLCLTVREVIKSIDLITVWQGEVIAGLKEENDVLEEINTILQQLVSLLG